MKTVFSGIWSPEPSFSGITTYFYLTTAFTLIYSKIMLSSNKILKAYMSIAGRHWWQSSEKDTVLDKSSHYSVRKLGLILNFLSLILLHAVNYQFLFFFFNYQFLSYIFCVYPLWSILTTSFKLSSPFAKNLCRKFQTELPASNLTSPQSILQTAPSVSLKPQIW